MHGGVWGDLLGGRAGGVAPLLPPVRAGRPSATQAHRLRHPRVERRLLRRGRRPALREDLRALRRLRALALRDAQRLGLG